MGKRALILASEACGLRGAVRDAKRMDAELSARGFDVARVVGEAATRAAVLKSVDGLVESAKPGDAIAVYFSGVSGRAIAKDDLASFDFLAPADFDDDPRAEFRGVLYVELAARLRKVADKTGNVTLIVDSSFTGSMARGSLRAKGLRRTQRPALAPLVSGLDRATFADPFGHPGIVRLFASGPWQTAFEFDDVRGEASGVFTDALLRALDEAGDVKLAWRRIAAYARGRVLLQTRTQDPVILGPDTRIAFTSEIADEPLEPPLVATGGGVFEIAAGKLLGVELGDGYDVLGSPSGATVGTAIVDAVSAHTARVAVTWANVADRTNELTARLTSRAPKRHPIALVQGSGQSGARGSRSPIAGTIDRSKYVRLADSAEEALAIVTVQGNAATLHDRSGEELSRYDSIDPLMRDLAHIAVAHSLRSLAGSHGLAESDVEVAFGRIGAYNLEPLPARGELVTTADWIAINLVNRSKATRYVHVVDIDVTHEISHVTDADPSGIPLSPGQECVVGMYDGPNFVGLPLSWAKNLPLNGPRLEQLVVIVSAMPCDLGPLETAREDVAPRKDASDLEALIDAVARARPRRASPAGKPEGFAATVLDFRLAPWLAPEATKPQPVPEITKRPGTKIAVRLAGLVVSKTPSIFRGAIRVDAMVVSRGSPKPSAKPSPKPYQVQTLRFDDAKPGDSLPLDEALLYFGAARDFAQLVIWVSKDDGAPSLDALLASEIETGKNDDAAYAIAQDKFQLATTLPRLAYDLLARATGATVGLYQTTLLPEDGFGLGRHPPTGFQSAIDFEFAFSVKQAE